MFQNLLPAVFTFVLISYCNAYKLGAPEGVCVSMVPEHGVPPQPLPSPYTLSIDKTKVSPGGSVTVTLQSPEGETFKGFLLQARDSKTDNPVGTFTKVSGAKYKHLNCNGGKNNAITHNSNDEKSIIATTWTAPLKSTTVYFIVTTAKNGGEFWVGQKSSTVTVA